MSSCRTVPRSTEPGFSGPAPVGFIWHYPFNDAGSDRLALSGADTLMARCAWGVVEPERGFFDFDTLRRQLRVAREQGLRLVLLLEFNPFCAPDWLRAVCRDAGETVCSADGTVGDIPRTGSPQFLAAQKRLLNALAAFLEGADPQHTITHYIPGIEWWFPFEWRYSETDLAHFRRWLLREHGSLAALNRAWGTRYGAPEQLQVPVLGFDSHLWEQGRTGLTAVNLGFTPPGQGRPDVPLAPVNDWARFWHRTAAEYIDSVAALVKQFDRSRPCASFGSLVWAQAAEWDYTDWSRIGTDWLAHTAASQDILGLQLPFHHRDTYRQTFGLDVARKYGRPLWNMDLTDFALGYDAGLRAHLHATHAAVQHGATGLFYCNWNGDPDFDLYPNWTMADIAELVRQARGAVEITRGYHPLVQGALVNPITSSRLPGDPPFGRNRVLSTMGWYKLLERLPVTVDVVTLTEIEQEWVSLDGYKWVLVPDCGFVSDPALQAMSRFEKNGGLLLRGGRLGDWDENGRARPESPPPGMALDDLGRAYAGYAPLPRRSQVNPPPVMVWPEETEATARVRKRAMATLDRAFGTRGIAPQCTVRNHGLDVRATVMQRHSRLLVYLVNREPAPATGVVLELDHEELVVGQVYLDLEPHETSTLERTGTGALIVPPFAVSAAVEMRGWTGAK